MKTEIQQQFEDIKASWDKITNIPDDLTPWGFPGLNRQAIADALGSMSLTAAEIFNRNDFSPSSASWHALLQTINNIRSHVVQHIPSNPQPHIPGFLVLIEQARLSLRNWVSEENSAEKSIIPALAEKLTEATSRISDAESMHNRLLIACKDVENSAQQAILNAEQTALKTLEIQEKNAISGANLEEADKYLAIALRNSDDVNEMLSDVKALKAELEERKEAQEQLFGQLEIYRQKAESLLEDANRTGMAGSFITRKAELSSDIALWRNIFGLALVSLSLLGLFYVAPSLDPQKWQEALLRLPVTAPFIWLGWFSAKQYGYAVRLREDYAYKVASAMAFEGFKREARESSEQMHQKLLETAVTNFGDNPLRIYNGHENHASPLHEIIEKNLGNEKLIDLLKTFIAKLKS
ncbi:MAG: hypothetical protein JNL16_11810 [Dechloromonas sp.]|nr:hypothetical protein [Dechloromonas sp.]